MNKFIFPLALCCPPVVAFSTSQLPLSDKVAATFPKINTNCYIIVNLDTKVVLTEKNSQHVVDSGTFRTIYGGQETITLYEMSLLATGEGIKFFESPMSGVGCACKYKNKHGAMFLCLIYGEATQFEAYKDCAQVNKWLDQFYIYESSETEDVKIPVLYGIRNISKTGCAKKNFIMSINLNNRINKIYRYRTIMKAPINKNEDIGYIMYYTVLFKNPIVTKIYNTEYIKKKIWFKCVYDSVKYLIFGS
ncbi:MAG: hypothetical protein IJS10_02830 [Alphaproteobacteria bacterium]|nr:hypothetical protein [Alphaproteobacteria bacterium]